MVLADTLGRPEKDLKEIIKPRRTIKRAVLKNLPKRNGYKTQYNIFRDERAMGGMLYLPLEG